MSRQIRLEDHVYERIESKKRDDESFGEAVERLIDEKSSLDPRDTLDEQQAEEIRDAVETYR